MELAQSAYTYSALLAIAVTKATHFKSDTQSTQSTQITSSTVYKQTF